MADPGFYPHAPDRVDVRETHVSWVFLAGDRAFKLRKPVVFPFLDYGTPERRRHMCEEEVRLGRRLAPSLYRGVRAVVSHGAGQALAGADDPHASKTWWKRSGSTSRTHSPRGCGHTPSRRRRCGGWHVVSGVS